MAALGLPSAILDAIDAGIEALDAADALHADLEVGADDEDGDDAERVNEDGDELDFGERDDADLEPEPDDYDSGDSRWWQRPAHPPIGAGAHV